MLYWFIKILLFIPFSIMFPCRIIGKKRIPKGKCIIICNHRSNIDYIYLWNKIWRKQYVLAKKELFKGKLVNCFFTKMGGIPVDRESIDLSVIKNSLTALKKNKILTIFPEATRNKTSQDLLEFKAGASVFSIKANAPIVPIYIQKRPHFLGFNRIVVGEPIFFDDSYKGTEGTERANEVLREKMLELKDRKK
ncbi:MAG: lysophospholipid acyltransferase family protein [Eubacteriales bacterium]|nr:lysophospholipid acyltransferase family protein [Eubacteriales bacterium]